MMRAIQLGVVCVAGLLATAGQVQAGIITVLEATTDMGNDADLVKTINGAGLLDVPGPDADHERSDADNSWLSSSGNRLGFIDFDLGSLFVVDGFFFWNHSSVGVGIRTVDISTSTDGATFAPAAVSPSEFSKAPAFFSVPPEEISVAPVTARYIRFEVTENYDDDDQTGFSEIAFSGSPSATAAPEPSSVALLGIAAGVAGVVAARRRRREKQNAAAV